MNWETLLRKGLRTRRDVRAVRRGRTVKRIKRRLWGKLTGRIARRWD
jgi:hypothetical protein